MLGEDGKYIEVWDMPTYAVMVNKKEKQQLNGVILGNEINKLMHKYPGLHVFCEKIWSQAPHKGKGAVCPVCKAPKFGSITAQGNQMLNYGMILGILMTLEVPYTLVAPITWKKKVLKGINVDGKNASVIRIQQLYPTAQLLKTSRCRVPSDGRADALCIARWGFEEEKAS